MCEFIQRTIRDEVQKGIAEELPKREAVTLIQFTENLQKNLNCTLSEALKYLNKTFEDYTQAIQLLQTLPNT